MCMHTEMYPTFQMYGVQSTSRGEGGSSLQIRRHQHLEIDFRSLSASQQGHPDAAQTDMHGNQGKAMLWLLPMAHYPRDKCLSEFFSHTVPTHLAAVVVTKTQDPRHSLPVRRNVSEDKSPRDHLWNKPANKIQDLLPLIMRDTITDNPHHGRASNGPSLSSALIAFTATQRTYNTCWLISFPRRRTIPAVSINNLGL